MKVPNEDITNICCSVQLTHRTQVFAAADLSSTDSAVALAIQKSLLLLAAARLSLALQMTFPPLLACRPAGMLKGWQIGHILDAFEESISQPPHCVLLFRWPSVPSGVQTCWHALQIYHLTIDAGKSLPVCRRTGLWPSDGLACRTGSTNSYLR